MDAIRQDIRFALRLLRESPLLTLLTLLTLALGIGANTTLFTVVNGALLRPLPYRRPSSSWRFAQAEQPFAVSLPNLLDWQKQAGHWWVAGYALASVNLTGGGEAERAQGLVATGQLFDVLGVAAARGRTWNAADESDNGVLLTDALWRARFGADPAIIGRDITLNGVGRTVIGVMPPSFRFGEVQLFTRLQINREESRGNFFLQAVARLTPGVTIDAAQRELDGIGEELARQYSGHGVGALLRPLHTSIVGSARVPLLVLLGAVGLVLLIACVNVATLLLTRGDARRRELALQGALGAVRASWFVSCSPSHCSRACWARALALFAAWSTDALLRLVPGAVPRAAEVTLDERVLCFSLALSLFTGLLFGIVPALRASGFRLTPALLEGGRTATAGRARNRTRQVLVVAEIALALVPLAGAGLLLRTLDRLFAVNPGFRADHVLTASYSLPRLTYNNDERVAQYAVELAARAAALPGAQVAGIISHPPLGNDDAASSLEIAGRPVPAGSETPWAKVRAASPGYFAAAGITLLRGRSFRDSDNERGTLVAVIDDAFAHQLFPNEDPIGRRVIIGFDPEHPREIVGVVRSVRHSALTSEPEPMVYFPIAQQPLRDAAVFLRTAGNPESLRALLLSAADAVDPQIPLFNVRTLDQAVSASLARPRFTSLLFTAFASFALLIAAVGVYGVVALTVAERRREVGIRIALGARYSDIIYLVVGEGVEWRSRCWRGVARALVAGRLLRTRMFEVSTSDAIALGSASALMILVAWQPVIARARRD
jgi:predicted permease